MPRADTYLQGLTDATAIRQTSRLREVPKLEEVRNGRFSSDKDLLAGCTGYWRSAGNLAVAKEQQDFAGV